MCNMTESDRKKRKGEMDNWICFLSLKSNQVAVPISSIRIDELYASLNKGNWVSSDKPDLCNDDIGVVVEEMEVDDSERLTGRGKLFNPKRSSDEHVRKEVRDFVKYTGIAPTDIPIHVNSDPTLRDTNFEGEVHEYEYYVANFNRVVKGHAKKAPTYRKNHPDKTLIFYINDISIGYPCNTSGGDRVQPHVYFWDKKLIDALSVSGADYVVWHAPFKNDGTHFDLPEAVIFDVKSLPSWKDTVEYSTSG